MSPVLASLIKVKMHKNPSLSRVPSRIGGTSLFLWFDCGAFESNMGRVVRETKLLSSMYLELFWLYVPVRTSAPMSAVGTTVEGTGASLSAECQVALSSCSFL